MPPVFRAGGYGIADAVSHASDRPLPAVEPAEFMHGGGPFMIDQNADVGVLLLHGFTGTPHQFRELSRLLAERGYTVFSPVIAGHGTTPRELEQTTSGDWVQTAEAALQRLRARVRQVFVVGNSFGGNLAFWLAANHPEVISGVVSLGTAIRLRWHALHVARLYTYGWFIRYHRKLGREYKIDYIDLADEVSYPVIPLKSLREFHRFLRQKTIPTLSAVTAPTLLIQADEDKVVHPRSVQYIHEHVSSRYKKVCWLNSRYHNLHESDRRDEIFRRIDAFIRELTVQP